MIIKGNNNNNNNNNDDDDDDNMSLSNELPRMRYYRLAGSLAAQGRAGYVSDFNHCLVAGCG